MSPGPDREAMLAQALADFLDRQARDETPTIDGFCRNYPEVAGELRPQLETLAAIDQVLSPPAADAVPMPETLSGYKILGEIGSGGMGRVFLAMDERLGRKVAIKTLHPRFAGHPVLRARFMHEARLMAQVSHPHIARVYALGPDHEPPHFVMEYVEGAPLTTAAQPLTLHQKAELMRKVAVAVGILNDRQVVHRDLKPGNILVGPDLEPKLLDFGLALHLAGHEARLTLPGEIVATPEYFSPEQARADAPLDARSDVFSLGVVFYELLTGILPFHAETLDEQIRAICQDDPVLPRRIGAEIPGELQNICMKALEKSPADRYATAQEMAADLERFLAGEAVLAAPASYARMMTGKIAQHVRDLDGWKQDRILSDSEYDALRKGYDRLAEREDTWIMEVRRLSLPQVSLYLGAWILVVGAALLVLFRYHGLSGTPAVLVAAAAAAPTAWIGLRCWKMEQRRVAVAYLLAFCLLLPITLLVAMGEYGIFGGFTQGRRDLELFSKFDSFKMTTNAQLWWSLLVSLPAYYWLRRFTRASVFSLVLAVMAALWCLACLLRMGMIGWLDNDPGRPYFYLLPCAGLFFAAAAGLERLRLSNDSRYFYPIAVVFTWAALTGIVTFHDPYAEWLKRFAPWTRGQVEYLFLINAGIYFLLQVVCERFPSAQLRTVAKSFRFVIPGHVMTSLLLLGLAASDRWQQSPANAAMRREARALEVLLPAVACVFVLGSIPKQMKNFFASGMLFLAIGLVRLQQDFFRGHAWWPVSLLLTGVLLMALAARYAPLKMAFERVFRFSR
ncbi:MAG TPA: serine/threonine-protein kinase [Bryobacteraceae bacterium]|nr:serine/threonine-protein kinase [Bryobacteraceae bacterium]